MNAHNNKGFSLIELMIVIGIVGILAYLAVGNFSDSSLRASRTDARAALVDAAAALEKCRAVYGTYNNANCSVSNGDSIASKEGLYNVGVVSAATTFTLTATPSVGSGQAKDTGCLSITLNNLGVQGPAAGDCW